MFRFLFLLVGIGVVAYLTNPAQSAFEAKAEPLVKGAAVVESPEASLIDKAEAYVKGMLAGEGRYENFFLASKYTVDMPGADYVECYGAFTLIQCSVATPGAQ